MSARRLDATALRDWAHTAVGGLITHTDEINRLNVFPVADADTGTNMLFTMRAALRAGRLAAATTDVVGVAAALAEGALHGARGNSGRHPVADPARPGRRHRRGGRRTRRRPHRHRRRRCSAPRCATRSAWWSPRWARPCPGTIVSVLQAAAGAAEDARGRRCGPGRGRRGRRAERGGRSPWRRPRNSSTCWPRRAWSTRAGAGCWSCSTR